MQIDCMAFLVESPSFSKRICCETCLKRRRQIYYWKACRFFFAVHRRTRNVGTIGPKQKKSGSERKRDKLIIQNYFVLSFFLHWCGRYYFGLSQHDLNIVCIYLDAVAAISHKNVLWEENVKYLTGERREGYPAWCLVYQNSPFSREGEIVATTHPV